MGIVGRQFANPRGIAGRIVGRAMVRGNASFNVWVIRTVVGEVGQISRVVELGPGPGVGLHELLHALPQAHVWGVDRSPAMIAQARQRNRAALADGRLVLIEGDLIFLSLVAPVDLVIAVHVLYFLHDPVSELSRVRSALVAGGEIALGYRLGRDMPRISQRQFAAEGHRLYDSDDEVAAHLSAAGFAETQLTIQDPGGTAGGRVMIART
jgi:SAM-dependent methyltransferase